MSNVRLTRREAAKLAGATALVSAISMPWVRRASAATEINHWSWLAASDGEVWAQMIKDFNAANKDVQIKMDLVPEDQYTTKILTAAAAGKAPDFGWGTAGQRAQWAADGVIQPLNDLAKKVGLDLGDFSEFSEIGRAHV